MRRNFVGTFFFPAGHNTYFCDVAISVSGRDEANSALRLATRVFKIHSGLPALSRKKNFPESHVINSLLTKMA